MMFKRHPSNRRISAGVAGGIAICLLVFISSQARATDLSEKLKTVYLVNIAKFVVWKRGADQVNLCIHQQASIFEQALRIDGVQIGQGRHLRVIELPGADHQCDLQFWDARSIKFRDKELTERVLEVADLEQDKAEGIEVFLFIDGNRLRFHIDEGSLSGREFEISSELRRLSRQQPLPNYQVRQ
ncbi:YfiR family protein [Pseudomaricurvus alkylphenolicus]|jgi:hypothetical protein|uniref:YfiR family protein n=1 Tax=Pseudomaricurvus alkylphenolicus TaxID=1306991 RepID=UPI001420077E|nr:YfiR family protein [Pseudomaricurvus alkylphenolicus]NIB42622.1 YfiR family protein [Pseudomaricurvus alkylphenolicus]